MNSFDTPPPLPRPAIAWKKGAKWALLGVFMVFLPWLGGSLVNESEPKCDYGISSAPWMPKGASNGAYYRWRSVYREYDISEEDFRQMMRDESLAVTEISEPMTVPRYLVRLIDPTDLKYKGLSYPDRQDAYKHDTTVRIVNGLFCEKEDYPGSNGYGDSHWYFYDRDLQRAFTYY